MGKHGGVLRGLALATLLAGCAATDPAVPEGARIYLARVSYAGQTHVATGRKFAPLFESAVRRLVSAAGVVDLVPESERATADYVLEIRLTDVRHTLEITTYMPDGGYSFLSELFVEGEYRFEPRNRSGVALEKRFPVRDPDDDTQGWTIGQAIGGGTRGLSPPESLKVGSGELLRSHAEPEAVRILLDLGLVTNKRLVAHYDEG
ncbi:MAG: hypothetical protein AAGD14_08845 [Planctomycetota bacterium]